MKINLDILGYDRALAEALERDIRGANNPNVHW